MLVCRQGNIGISLCPTGSRKKQNPHGKPVRRMNKLSVDFFEKLH
jgi:hypothetical protein